MGTQTKGRAHGLDSFVMARQHVDMSCVCGHVFPPLSLMARESLDAMAEHVAQASAAAARQAAAS